MPTVVQEFDSVSITNASIQFFDGETQQNGTKFGCVGSIEGETEGVEIVKKCEGIEAKRKFKPTKMNVNVNAHIPVQVGRDIFGLKNTDLKPGVYSYGELSQSKRFVFTADVIDEFEDVKKLIAFPNCSNTTGFRISIENAADEVAMLELSFAVLKDTLGNLYYEAFVDELDDQTVADTWHSLFTPELIQIPTP